MSEPDLTTDRFCPGCGYDLRGIPSDRCPECGTPFDPNQPTEPQIPWSHRDTLGRRKAFWRTVKIATFNTSRFAGEVNRPVSLPDAKAFRRAVALHAFIPTGLLAGGGYLIGFDLFQQSWYPRDVFGSITLWLGLPVMLASLWLFFLMSFGMLSYFFHPEDLPVRKQNRAVALSYYACSPWAYFFVVPLVAVVYFGVVWMSDGVGGPPILLIGVMSLAALVPIVLWVAAVWFTPQRMLDRTTHCSRSRLVLMGFVVQPLGYALCLLLTVGLINLAYWFVVLLVQSLI